MILSVLDQSPVRAGGTAADALNETVALAQAAERWGYHRYWLAEHHATEGLAGSAPEIMIARVAAATSSMRVGSGGVMLSHYSPLKVAETFRVLETLYPGRIDLGLGRAPGTDPATSYALRRRQGISEEDDFLERFNELMLLETRAFPYKLIGGVHEWYSNPMDVSGQVPFNPDFDSNTGITTNDIVWNFFASHPKP